MKSSKQYHRTGTGRHTFWRPIPVFVAAVLLAMVCLWWFLMNAIATERIVATQRLSESNQASLSAARDRLLQGWSEYLRTIEELANDMRPAQIFGEIVHHQLADSAIIHDEAGRAQYPALGSEPRTLSDVTDPKRQHGKLIISSLRRDIELGNWEEASRMVSLLEDGIYDDVVDRSGRLLAANGCWLYLESHPNQASDAFSTHALNLARRLNTYAGSVIPSTQRRFLMHGLQECLSETSFPTLVAEDLAAEILRHQQMSTLSGQAGAIWSVAPGIWASRTSQPSITVLLTESNLTNLLQGELADHQVTVKKNSNAVSSDAPTLPIGGFLPGWNLQLDQIGKASSKVATLFLWLGVFATIAMATVAWVISSGLIRESNQAQMKQNLASAVSHELKTPLSSMRVLVDLLLDDPVLEQEKTREYLQLMAKENARLTQLVENFLTFSRLERRRERHSTHERIDLQPMLTEIAESARASFAGDRLSLKLEPGLPRVAADPAALQSAITNLVDNASKYSSVAAPVVMRAFARSSGDVCIEVQDQGPGLSNREKRDAFQAFDRLGKGESDYPSGCGLGLYIVQTVVKDLGGEIEIDSQPGDGSIFRIVMPAVIADSLGDS